MKALISDIHSNVEALEAVFADMESFPVEEVLCLGDVIGYGPDPRRTLDMVRRCTWTLLGNHEEGLLRTAENFNERARRALEWTRDRMNAADSPREENYALWEQVDGFLETRREGEHLFVHASPRSPIREYVMPADALDREKMAAIYTSLDGCRVGFGGHTHVPGIFSEGRLFRHQSEISDRLELPRAPSFVNIGSVGQPRDGDPRASYVLLDVDSIIFRRVTYDVEATMRKIRAIPELDDFLARRLKKGQ